VLVGSVATISELVKESTVRAAPLKCTVGVFFAGLNPEPLMVTWFVV
jgi:hypothetical protein